MFCVKMADLIICINNKYNYVESLCKDYIINDVKESEYDMCIEVSQEAVLKEQEEGEIEFPLAYCESICVYREISKKLINYNGFLMHGACIEMDGDVYAFCAKSGTGKTTHLNLWMKAFGEKVRIINGDKPIIRLIDGKFMVYGTPWCGKEGYNINTSAVLKALCFIERGIDNSIEQIEQSKVMNRLVHQILMPVNPMEMVTYLDMLDALIRNTPVYLLKCNMKEEAAHVAYEGMK